MLALSHAETEHENALKVGGNFTEVSILFTRASTSFRHVAAYIN